MQENYSLGIDIGSTTAKLVLMRGDDIVYQKYQRHRSKVRATTLELLREMRKEHDIPSLKVTVSGSAGMGKAEKAGIDFIQEVYATGSND